MIVWFLYKEIGYSSGGGMVFRFKIEEFLDFVVGILLICFKNEDNEIS